MNHWFITTFKFFLIFFLPHLSLCEYVYCISNSHLTFVSLKEPSRITVYSCRDNRSCFSVTDDFNRPVFPRSRSDVFREVRKKIQQFSHGNSYSPAIALALIWGLAHRWYINNKSGFHMKISGSISVCKCFISLLKLTGLNQWELNALFF